MILPCQRGFVSMGRLQMIDKLKRYFQDAVENKLDTKEWPHQSECPAAWNGSGAVRYSRFLFVSDNTITNSFCK